MSRFFEYLNRSEESEEGGVPSFFRPEEEEESESPFFSAIARRDATDVLRPDEDPPEDTGITGLVSRFSDSIAGFLNSLDKRREPPLSSPAQDASRALPQGTPDLMPLNQRELEQGAPQAPAMTVSPRQGPLPDRRGERSLGDIMRTAAQPQAGVAETLASIPEGLGRMLRVGAEKLGGVMPTRVGTMENPLAGIGQAAEATGQAGRAAIDRTVGDPQTTLGRVGRGTGRIGSELGLFLAGGSLAHAPKAGAAMNILRATAANAPLDVAIGASGEGGVPAALELAGEEEMAERIRQNPLLAGAAELGLGAGFETAGRLVGPTVRGARRLKEGIDEFGEFIGRKRLGRKLASVSDIPDAEAAQRALEARMTRDLRPVGEDIRAPLLAARTGEPVEATLFRGHNSTLGTVEEVVDQSPYGGAFFTDDIDLAETFVGMDVAGQRELVETELRLKNPFVLEEESIDEMAEIVAHQIRENPDDFNHVDRVVKHAMAGHDLDEATQRVANMIDQEAISGAGGTQLLKAMRKAGYDGIVSRFGDAVLGGRHSRSIRGIGHEVAVLDPSAVREVRPTTMPDPREVPTFITSSRRGGEVAVPKGDMPTSIDDAMGRGFVRVAGDGALMITERGRAAGFDGRSLGFADSSVMAALARAGVGGAAGGAADVGPLEDVPLGGRIAIGMATGMAAPAIGRLIAKPFTRMKEIDMREAVERITREENEQLERLVGQGELFPDQRGPTRAAEINTPKDINVPEVVRRITQRTANASREQLRQIFESVDSQIRAGDDLGQVEITNDETLRLARHVGFDPSALKEFTSGEARRQTVAALIEIDAKSRALVELRQLAGRVQSRVSDARWEEIMARMNQLEKEIDVAAGSALKGGSEFGRGLQAQKINIFARETFSAENSSPWIVEWRRLSKDKLSADDIARGREILRNGSMDDMRKFMERMATKGKNWGEKYATLVKAGLLSAPKTDLLNLISTGTHMGLRMLEEPAAAWADKLMAIGTGQRSQSITLDIGDRLRSIPEGLELGWNGDPELGLRGFKEVIRGGLGDDALIKYDFRGMRTGFLPVDLYIQWGFNRLGAEDAMMKGFAFVNSAQERARVHALNELGLRSAPKQGDEAYEAFRGIVNNTMADMPDWLSLSAIADAEMATFTNMNSLGRGINNFKAQLREASGFGAAAGELLVPFVNTLVNVGAAFGRRTPGSFAAREDFWRPAVKLLTHADDVTKAEQRELARMFAEQGTGVAALTIGYHLRKKGLTTAAFPEDSDTRNAFIEQNIQPFAISGRTFPGVRDDLTIGMENISPLGNLIGLGGQMYDYINDPEADIFFNKDEPLKTASDFDKLASGQFSAMLHQLSDMTFLANVSSALSAITDPEVGAERYLEQLARMHVPTILRQSATVGDPTLRRVEGMGQAVQASLPGQSKKLEPSISGLGGTRERSPGGMTPGEPVFTGKFNPLRALNPILSSGFEGVFNPFRIENVNDDPVLNKLSSLDVGIPRLQTAERRDLEGRNRTLIENLYGQNVRARLEQLFQSERFQSLPERAPEGEPSQQRAASLEISRARSDVTEMLESEGLLPTEEEPQPSDPFLQAETGGSPAPDNSSGSAFFDYLEQ